MKSVFLSEKTENFVNSEKDEDIYVKMMMLDIEDKTGMKKESILTETIGFYLTRRMFNGTITLNEVFESYELYNELNYDEYENLVKEVCGNMDEIEYDEINEGVFEHIIEWKEFHGDKISEDYLRGCKDIYRDVYLENEEYFEDLNVSDRMIAGLIVYWAGNVTAFSSDNKQPDQVSEFYNVEIDEFLETKTKIRNETGTGIDPVAENDILETIWSVADEYMIQDESMHEGIDWLYNEVEKDRIAKYDKNLVVRAVIYEGVRRNYDEQIAEITINKMKKPKSIKRIYKKLY